MSFNVKSPSTNIKLSICIPTYNRARFIGETIGSVISQAGDNVEIVIVDGASADNTQEVVKKYQQKFNNLIYYRREKNMGVDKDMAKTIELSRGDYCWMLSDDDLLKPGSINRILKEIELGYEIYLCNVTVCDAFMHPTRERFWLSLNIQDKVFNLHDPDKFIEYCNNANSLGALFSFMSSIILRREEWNKTGFDHDFDGSAYALASSLLSFIKRKCRLKYIRSSLVLWRKDNESFIGAGGLVKRFLLDFNGYLRLAEKYLSGVPQIKNPFLKVMRREHPWYTIIHVSSFINNHESWLEFKNTMLKFGYNPNMATICFGLSRNKDLISWAVMIKRKIVNRRWISRK